MDEIFLVLLYLVTLVFVLVIIALLGHFLWIAGAELLQMLLGVEDKRDRPRESILELEVDRDRRATRRYLKRLLNLRLLDRTTVGRVEGAALLDERKLHRTPDRTPATPAAKRLETGLPAGPISSPQQAPTPPPSPSPRRKPLERALPTVQAPARQPETVAGQAPTRERRSFSDLLSAFMVEKNIRWGELVGSLLIVFCSAALVVSFWTQIARVPLAQVGLFTAITAGLFGIGLYTEHRWRLANTSRGLLLIATLLVPLNFLTIGAFARDVGPLALSVLGMETVAAALFGFLLYRSAAIYAAGRAAQVTAAVLGASLLQLVVRRATGPELALPWLVAIGALPLLLYGGVIGSALRQAAGSRTLSLDEARSLLVLLGLGTFATSVALGLFVHLSGEARTLATRLSTLMSLYGLPALLSGLHFWRATPSGAPA